MSMYKTNCDTLSYIFNVSNESFNYNLTITFRLHGNEVSKIRLWIHYFKNGGKSL